MTGTGRMRQPCQACPGAGAWPGPSAWCARTTGGRTTPEDCRTALGGLAGRSLRRIGHDRPGQLGHRWSGLGAATEGGSGQQRAECPRQRAAARPGPSLAADPHRQRGTRTDSARPAPTARGWGRVLDAAWATFSAAVSPYSLVRVLVEAAAIAARTGDSRWAVLGSAGIYPGRGRGSGAGRRRTPA